MGDRLKLKIKADEGGRSSQARRVGEEERERREEEEGEEWRKRRSLSPAVLPIDRPRRLGPSK